MAKRNLAAALALLVVAAPFAARAGLVGPDARDCGRLADLVYAEVLAHYLDNVGSPVGAGPAEASTRVVVCEATAQTVSQAFSRAVAAVGGSVDWGWPPQGGGDVCLSGFIDQCYPDRGARVPGTAVTGTRAAWLAVRQTVLLAMPWGSAADRAVFSPGPMRRALRDALRHTRR